MATEEILCENSQVPEFLNSCEIYEISWHFEVLRGNEYISDYWAHIYVILKWFPSSVRIHSNLSVHSIVRNQWELAIPFLTNHVSAHSITRNQSDCFPSREGKWSDWLRVICFVFKTVVPKHRFCKLQNVWNVCEFGSDYMAPWVNIIDSLNMTLSYIGGIYS